MNEQHDDPMVASAERLCQTLERIGDALVSLDAQTLLETEESLAQMLAALSASDAIHDKAALRDRVTRARDALLRCRRLGASYTSVAGPRVRLRTGSELYGRTGEYVEQAVSGAKVKVAV
jgi:hypothetical protein